MYGNDHSKALSAGIEGADVLASGLRMLRMLADNAPVSLAGFAEMNTLCLPDAARFMVTFQNCGYVRQLSFGELYVLTPQAVSIVGGVDPSGVAASPALQ